MNNESLRLHQLALRKRRQYLDLVYSKDGAAPKRAGLVGLGRAVYLLATRHIPPPEWPGHDVDEETKLVWEVEWYSHYLEALVELTPRLQAAICDGKITPRGIRTRAPIDLGKMSQWLHLDAKTTIAASTKIFWNGIVPETPYSPWEGWADASVMPSGICVTPDDFAVWADAEGIATLGEVNTLLVDAQNSNSETSEKAAPPVASSDWRDSARAIADEFFDNDTANKCRDSLAGYSQRVMVEMQKRGIHGPRGLINNPRTIQREALQGAKWWAGKPK